MEKRDFVFDERASEAIEWSLRRGRAAPFEKAVFYLCKAIKGLYPDANPKNLKEAVRHWWAFSNVRFSENSLEDAECEFLVAWPKARPRIADEDWVSEAFNTAKRIPFPKCAMQFESETRRLLVALCAELAVRCEDGEFYLSCEKAAEVLGISKVAANRTLNLLVVVEILEVTQEYTASEARRFVFIGER